MSKFSDEGRGELGTSVRDDMVMKAELEEDMLEKDFGNVHCRGCFVARMEIYPLRKTMVYHNQDKIKAMEGGEVGDKVHRDLLKGADAFGQDW